MSDNAQEPTGRELDAYIATHICGWESMHLSGLYKDDKGEVVFFDHIPYYSTSIEAAWALVEKLRENHLYLLRLTNGEHNYICWIGRGIAGPDIRGSALANTAPEAIALAAYRAHRAVVEGEE